MIVMFPCAGDLFHQDKATPFDMQVIQNCFQKHTFDFQLLH